MSLRVIAVFGPTASGKSTVAEAVAGRIGGELVSADSAQVYRGLPILTNQSQARLVGYLVGGAGYAIGSLDHHIAGTVAGTPVKLTSHEYRLLSYLMHHSGRVVSRTELVEHLYDQDFDRDSNTIEVFVGRIRKKLGVEIIQTVRGLGYLLTPPADAR